MQEQRKKVFRGFGNKPRQELEDSGWLDGPEAIADEVTVTRDRQVSVDECVWWRCSGWLSPWERVKCNCRSHRFCPGRCVLHEEHSMSSLSGLGSWTEGSVAVSQMSLERHFAIGNASWEGFLEGGGQGVGVWGPRALSLRSYWLFCTHAGYTVMANTAFPLLYWGRLPSSLGCCGFYMLEPHYRFLISILAVLSRLGAK